LPDLDPHTGAADPDPDPYPFQLNVKLNFTLFHKILTYFCAGEKSGKYPARNLPPAQWEINVFVLS
jgi:hypothetical protein